MLVYLREPQEKLWGVLRRLDTTGVLLEGIDLSSFDDWMAQAASDEAPMLGLVSMFAPLSRVERIFRDEPVGPVASYAQRFERRVGCSVEAFLAEL